MKNRANPFALAAVVAAGKCARHLRRHVESAWMSGIQTLRARCNAKICCI